MFLQIRFQQHHKTTREYYRNHKNSNRTANSVVNNDSIESVLVSKSNAILLLPKQMTLLGRFLSMKVTYTVQGKRLIPDQMMELFLLSKSNIQLTIVRLNGTTSLHQ